MNLSFGLLNIIFVWKLRRCNEGYIVQLLTNFNETLTKFISLVVDEKFRGRQNILTRVGLSASGCAFHFRSRDKGIKWVVSLSFSPSLYSRAKVWLGCTINDPSFAKFLFRNDVYLFFVFFFAHTTNERFDLYNLDGHFSHCNFHTSPLDKY